MKLTTPLNEHPSPIAITHDMPAHAIETVGQRLPGGLAVGGGGGLFVEEGGLLEEAGAHVGREEGWV